jgi:hypothetical protein
MSHQTTTLTGGNEFSITKRDGTNETVFVRQLAIKEFPKFLQVQDDELEMIDFACGKTKGFAETLSPESHEALIAQIEKVNGDFFSRWLARRRTRVERIVPDAFEKAIVAPART